jgi:DNA-binding transcriptional ArsR family regulator
MLINTDGNYADEQLSSTFAALADPTRRAILAQLTEGEATVTELAEPHAKSLPAVSRHLKALEKSGLISKGRDAQWRPCRLNAAPLRDVDSWLTTYRAFFEDRIDRLQAHLATMTSEPPPKTQTEE